MWPQAYFESWQIRNPQQRTSPSVALLLHSMRDGRQTQGLSDGESYGVWESVQGCTGQRLTGGFC